MRVWIFAGLIITTLLGAQAFGADEPFFGLEASYGMGEDDNMVYSRIPSPEGRDSVQDLMLKLSVRPKLIDPLLIDLSIKFVSDSYRRRPSFNTTSQVAEASLRYNPFGLHYIYLSTGLEEANIGSLTRYNKGSAGLEYIFDITGTSWFWTALYAESAAEKYSDAGYALLNNSSEMFGIRQNITGWFYISFETLDSRAGQKDLSYTHDTGTMALSVPIPSGTEFTIGCSYGEKMYWGGSTFNIVPAPPIPPFTITYPPRLDKEGTAFVMIEQKLFAGLSIVASIYSIRNECNLLPEHTRQGYGSYRENAYNVSVNYKL